MALSPLAGKPAPKEILVDLPLLERDYFERRPDPDDPAQQVSFGTNQAMEDVGSVYCGQWNVQSGNHPNPMVSYDANASAPVRPGLRLVE